MVVADPPTTTTRQSWLDFANKPLLKEMGNQLIPHLRQSLKTRLPEYMIPSTITQLDTMPLNSNGKVDRKALPAPLRLQAASTGSIALPETVLEERVATIMADVLSLETIGRNQSFFEIGGHSLLAIQVIIRIRDAFGVDMALGSMFEFTTVAELAQAIERMQAEEAAQDKPVAADEEREVLTI